MDWFIQMIERNSESIDALGPLAILIIVAFAMVKVISFLGRSPKAGTK